MKTQLTRKKFWIFPTLFMGFLLLVITVFAQKPNSANSPEESYKLSLVSDSPVFPGCVGTEFEIRKCLSESFSEHFKNNFDSDLLRNLDVKNDKKTGVYVQFVINNKGQISSIRTSSQDENIKNEVDRIAHMIPTMIPGKRKGQVVNVKHSVSLRIKDGQLEVKSKPTVY